MKNRAYLAISGTMFFLMSTAHLLRAIQNWSVQVAQWAIPMEVSWFGFILTFALALWAFKQFTNSKNAP